MLGKCKICLKIGEKDEKITRIGIGNYDDYLAV